MVVGFQSHWKKRMAKIKEDNCEVSAKRFQAALNGENKTLEKAGADV